MNIVNIFPPHLKIYMMTLIFARKTSNDTKHWFLNSRLLPRLTAQAGNTASTLKINLACLYYYLLLADCVRE